MLDLTWEEIGEKADALKALGETKQHVWKDDKIPWAHTEGINLNSNFWETDTGRFQCWATHPSGIRVEWYFSLLHDRAMSWEADGTRPPEPGSVREDELLRVLALLPAAPAEALRQYLRDKANTLEDNARRLRKLAEVGR